jgi:hypothetical protein
MRRAGGSRILTGASVCVLLGLALAAFWPFEFHPVNHVRWLPGRDGIDIYGRGLIYSREPLPLSRGEAAGAVTIQIALEADGEIRSHVGNVLSLFDQSGRERLIIGQWQAGLSIFSLGVGARPDATGESVPPSRSLVGYHEIGLDDSIVGRPRVLTLVSGRGGTAIYLDQTEVGRYRDAVADTLFQAPCRVVIGSSATGEDEWNGKVYWLAIYDRELTADEVQQDYRSLGRRTGGLAPGRAGLRAFYAFHEGAGTRVRNAVADRTDLEVPPAFFALEKRVLTPPWEEFRRGEFSMGDVTLNVLGFVPFGLAFTLWGVRNRGFSPRGTAAAVVMFGLISSVLIELVQVRMPGRTSSATDVATNVAGTALGAALAWWYLSRPRGCARALPGE